MSDTIVSLVKSRRASIVKLQDEVAELGKQMAPLPLSSAPRMALASVVKVKETRLAKLREELRGMGWLFGCLRTWLMIRIRP